MPNKFTLTGEPIEEIAPIDFSQKPIHSCKFPPKVQRNPETYIFTRVNKNDQIGYEILKIQTWQTVSSTTVYAQVEYESNGCHSRIVSKSSGSDSNINESVAIVNSLIEIIDYSEVNIHYKYKQNSVNAMILKIYRAGWMGWLQQNCWTQVSRHSAKTIQSGAESRKSSSDIPGDTPGDTPNSTPSNFTDPGFIKPRKPLTLWECIQKFPSLKPAVEQRIKDHEDFNPDHHDIPGPFNRLLKETIKNILNAPAHYGSGTLSAARFLAQREYINLSQPIEERTAAYVYSFLETWDFAHRRAFLEILHSDFKFK